MEVFATVVGVTFRGQEAKEVVKHMTVEDSELLELRAEPTNEYDSHAVMVIYKPRDLHIGYLARENNFEIFQALEQGIELTIEIVGFENTLKPTLLVSSIDDISMPETHAQDMPIP